MNDFLKFFGIGLLLLSAFAFSSECRRRIKVKNETSEGFVSLLEHIRRQIDCYLTPAARLADGFKNEALQSCGYLQQAAKDGLASAYFALSERLPLYKSVKSELESFFGGFGREYKDGTLKELNLRISSLKELLKKEKDESDRNLKVTRTLAVSAALGAAILII